MAKRGTGTSTDYSGADEAMLEAAVEQAWANYGDGTPTRIRVSAQVEWSGVIDKGRGGHRTTTLDGLQTGALKKAVQAAQKAAQKAGEARPAASMKAKGWHAQLRALTEHRHGSAAADKAGLGPTARTLQEWLSESRSPSKANQGRITEAYDRLRNWGVDQAGDARSAAQHRVAEALNDAIKERYGADVRLRDITGFEFQ